MSHSTVRTITPTKLFSGLILLVASIVHTPQLSADVLTAPAYLEITKSRIKAGHFLSQSTMGYSPIQVILLGKRMLEIGEEAALNEWIDNEFSKPYQSVVSFTEATVAGDGFVMDENFLNNPNLNTPIPGYQQTMWWDRAVRGTDHLRQRVAWGLIQIFVTSGDVDPGRPDARWAQPLSYYDVLLSNAFGDYHSLLTEVTYHPFMGIYLSHLRNGKGDEANGIFADENYAREILQLFSMGVYQLEQDGSYIINSTTGMPEENYDNDDIKEFAKVFTGFSYAGVDGGQPNNFFIGSRNYEYPMYMYDDFHDMSEKHLLDSFVIPAGTDGSSDVAQALLHISTHPSVAPFMSRLLIQRLTSSNPSSGYISRVATAWNDANGLRGDFKAVIRAILMDTEARDSLQITEVVQPGGLIMLEVDSVDPLHGRLKEPVLMLSQFMKRYIPISSEPNGVLKPVTFYSMTKQEPLRAPHVFNFYSAEYQPGNGPLSDAATTNGESLVFPESELLSQSFVPMFKGMINLVRSGEIRQTVTASSVPAIMTSLVNDQNAERSMKSLINNIDLYMCYGTMPESLKADIAATMENDSIGNYTERYARTMGIILSSADYAIVH